MTCLLDVNVLMALLWENHEHHPKARTWFKGVSAFATCPVSQLGFARGVCLNKVKFSLFGLFLAGFLLALPVCASMAATSNVLDTTFQANQPSTTTAGNHRDRGMASIGQRDWEGAIVEFDEAIKHDPKDASAYEYRGCAYIMKQDLDKAIVDLSQAIQLNPTNSSAYFNRGGAYRIKNDFDKAVSDFSECLRLAPSNHMAFKARAAIHSRTRNFGKAIEDWSSGLRLDPNDATAFGFRGYAYDKKGQFDKALEDYVKALQLNPKHSDVLNSLAWLRATCPVASLRDGGEAVKAATEACNLTNWQSSDFIDTLAAAFAEFGDFEKAIKYQKQAIEMVDANQEALREMKMRLHMYEQSQPFQEAQ